MKHLVALTLLAMTIIFTAQLNRANASEMLSPGQVERFINSMNEVHALADEMEQEGKNQVIEARIKSPTQGEDFAPYSTAVQTLKSEFPDDYKKLGKITGAHDFSSQESWALIGDSVMEAYVSSQIGETEYQGIEAAQAQITPAMKAQMPPEALARMEQSMSMLDQLSNVPQENIDAVAPFRDRLESEMQE